MGFEKSYTAIKCGKGEFKLVEFLFVEEGSLYFGLFDKGIDIGEVGGGEHLSRLQDPAEFVGLLQEFIDLVDVLGERHFVDKIHP